MQDFSNVTVGKLPFKGPMMKPKPEKLVNQFFQKDAVTTRPKASIKIGLISQKMKSSAAEPSPTALAPGLETCPVSPPDGSYSMKSREDDEPKGLILLNKF